jgi:hypothetical protein
LRQSLSVETAGFKVSTQNSSSLMRRSALRATVQGQQPHDLAWQTLSDHLRTRNPAIKPGDIIRADRPFPHNTAQHMLGVHLFFAKWLGCQIVETKIPIRPPVATLAEAIMMTEAHTNLWLAFGCMGPGGSVSASNIDAVSFTPGQGFDYLARFYHVDRVAVRLRFSSIRLPDDWHPQDGNRIVIRDFEGEPL